MTSSLAKFRNRLQIRLAPSPRGAATRLELTGPLDAAGALALGQHLDAHLREGDRHLVLDLSGVEFVSSTGIGSLIASIAEFRDADGDVRLVSLTRPVREVFETLHLLDYVGEADPA